MPIDDLAGRVRAMHQSRAVVSLSIAAAAAASIVGGGSGILGALAMQAQWRPRKRTLDERVGPELAAKIRATNAETRRRIERWQRNIEKRKA